MTTTNANFFGRNIGRFQNRKYSSNRVENPSEEGEIKKSLSIKGMKMKLKDTYIFKNSTKLKMLFALLLCATSSGFAQDKEAEKQKKNDVRESQSLLSDASQALKKEKFVEAEADYRKAIALNPESETAKYNLGNAYYQDSKNGEALQRYKQAAQTATDKPAKHKAFHNLGNALMKEKNYQGAVEAYKNALRNNPTDDETRYNFALAKDMLEKNPPKDDQNKDDKNKDQDKKDQDKDQDKKDQGDNKDGDKGDEGDKKEDKDKGEQKDDKKEGDKEKDKGEPEKPKEGEGDQQQKQPVPGQLSPQQVKSLLEAMNNQEKKTQEKVNAQKQKGAKVNTGKDW